MARQLAQLGTLGRQLQVKVDDFHIQLALKRPEPVLAELRRRGIIVTSVGPFTNFRDPEGRVIKLSEERVSAL